MTITPMAMPAFAPVERPSLELDEEEGAAVLLSSSERVVVEEIEVGFGAGGLKSSLVTLKQGVVRVKSSGSTNVCEVC